MKKIMALVTALVMMVSSAACGTGDVTRSSGHGETEVKESVDIERLQSLSGMMLEVTFTVSDPYYVGTMKVAYNGDVSVPNPVNDYWLEMSEEDYLFIYNFCVDAYENNTYAGTSENVMDGTTYRFVYYDEDGNSHELYDGVITNNETLTAVVETIGMYSVD